MSSDLAGPYKKRQYEWNTYQGLNAPARTIFAHKPQLSLYRERLDVLVDVLCARILYTLQNFRFVYKVLDGFVLVIPRHIVVELVDVQDLDSDDLLGWVLATAQ